MARPRCVRFEIEYEDGEIIRWVGDKAEQHHGNLDTGCALAWAHGFHPDPNPAEVVRASRSGD